MSLVKIVYWSVKISKDTKNNLPRSPNFTIHFPKSGKTTLNIELSFLVYHKLNRMGIYFHSDSEIIDAVGCKFAITEKTMKNDHKTVSEYRMLRVGEVDKWSLKEGGGISDMIDTKELFKSNNMNRFFPDGEILIKIEFFVKYDEMDLQPPLVIEYLNEQKNQDPTIAPVPVSNEFFDRFVHQQEDRNLILKFPDGQRLVAEKPLLTTNSTVFKNMIEKGVIGGTEPIDLPDDSYPKMNELLRFIYTREVNIAENLDLALELYETAQHYEVEGLPDICLKHISDMLDKTNVLKVLSFAEQNNMPDLFHKCCAAIKKFYSEMEAEPEWNKLSLEMFRKIHRCIYVDCKDE